MGGWGALHLAVKHPDRFAAVTSRGAPFHRARHFPQIGRIFAGDGTAYYAEDPVTRFRRDAARVRAAGVRVRLVVGDRDGNLGFNRALAGRLTEWGVPHALTVVPGVAHDDADLYHRQGPGAFAFYRDLVPPAAP